jgi:hypothetical protein
MRRQTRIPVYSVDMELLKYGSDEVKKNFLQLHNEKWKSQNLTRLGERYKVLHISPFKHEFPLSNI